jgi:hypothetical protein
MLETFESSSAAERLHAVHAFIERVPVATEILIVGASRDAANDVVRRITLELGTTFGLHRASFMQLVVRLAAAEMARHGALHSARRTGGRGAGDIAGATRRGARVLRARRRFPGICCEHSSSRSRKADDTATGSGMQ